ncbi:MAG: AAA family ATPase [Sulfurimonas sp.]|nr:AAA family ATPase [Sulfurimonas sp.]
MDDEVGLKIEIYYSEKKYKELNYIYILLKVLSSKRELFNEDEYKKIKKWATDLSSVDNLLYLIDKINLKDLINKDAPKYEVMKINTCIDFHDNATYEDTIFTKNLEKTIHANIDELQSIFPYIPSWIDVEWFENSKSLKSLSSGEKILFTFLINLMYQVQNINNRSEYDTINLFLDETELGFHPQWQKKYLTKILDAIKTINNKKINLIFATHSPFILSDLPKDNVIFLEKGKQVDININPFRANIHTLLSHGFFMKDGLMGEFAKGKINQVYNFITKQDTSQIKTKVEAQQLINIIGEPLIKKQLQNLFNEYFEDNTMTIDDEIAFLETKLNALKRIKDD